jgi:uncharacterized protein (TIGR02996 family)
MAPDLPPGYLRAIIDLPDDDGPRLCAADWWDEQGAAGRAEFVRVQCELAKVMAGPCGPVPENSLWVQNDLRFHALRRRERELYRGEWDAEVIPAEWTTADEYYPTFIYCRGFVEEITCLAADFLAHQGALMAACPLRRVRLTDWPDRAELRESFRRRHGYDAYHAEGLDVRTWLKALWGEPFGIGFELPAAEFRPGSLAPSELPLTTDG